MVNLNHKKAFTMIELIFVIVILGILAGVAIPRMAGSREDACIAKLKSEISAIRSGIATFKSKALLSGKSCGSVYPSDLNKTSTTELFEGVLQTPLIRETNSDSCGWSWSGVEATKNQYIVNVYGKTIDFTYEDENGTFKCDSTAQSNSEENDLCKTLTK